MTALTHRGTTTAGNGSSTSRQISKHANTVEGDVQVLTLYLEHGTGGDYNANVSVSGTGAATWTLVHETFQGGAAVTFSHLTYLQVAGASEPAAYDVAWGGGAFWNTLTLDAWGGGDTTTPQDTTATEQASSTESTSATAPGLTTVTNDAAVVWLETDFDQRTVDDATPTGTTPTFAETTDFGTNCTKWGTLATAGATGDKTGTLNLGSWNTAQLVALRPAAAGGGGLSIPVAQASYRRRRAA